MTALEIDKRALKLEYLRVVCMGKVVAQRWLAVNADHYDIDRDALRDILYDNELLEETSPF